MSEYQKFINECLQINEAANNLGYMIKKYKVPVDVARSSILSMNRSANSEVRKISIKDLLKSRSDYGFIGFTTPNGSDWSYVYSETEQRWIACEWDNRRGVKLINWYQVKEDIKYICERYGYLDGYAEVLLGDKSLKLSQTTKNNIAITDLKYLIKNLNWEYDKNFKVSDKEISYRDYILYREDFKGYKQFFSYICEKTIPSSWNVSLRDTTNRTIRIFLKVDEFSLENIDSKDLRTLGSNLEKSINAIERYFRIWDDLRA